MEAVIIVPAADANEVADIFLTDRLALAPRLLSGWGLR